MGGALTLTIVYLIGLELGCTLMLRAKGVPTDQENSFSSFSGTISLKSLVCGLESKIDKRMKIETVTIGFRPRASTFFC